MKETAMNDSYKHNFFLFLGYQQ